MIFPLLGAALAADPWPLDAREGRAFVPASLLVAKPTLRVQVAGLDVSSVEIQHGASPPCQITSAIVDLGRYCGALFASPVGEGSWTVRVNGGGPSIALRTEEIELPLDGGGGAPSFPSNPGYVLALVQSEGARVWVADPSPQLRGDRYGSQRINDALTAKGAELMGLWSYNGTQAQTWKGGGATAPVVDAPKVVSAAPACPRADEDTLVICYWYGAPEPLYLSSPRGVIPTNTAIDVWVFGAPAGSEVSVDGAVGLSAGVVDKSESLGAVVQSGTRAADAPLRRHFSPRLAGEIQVSLDDGSGAVVITELLVVERYIGALRMGIGLSNVVDADYVAITAPGSATAEISVASTDRFAPELVLGFAPFVFDGDGRVYAPGYGHKRVAPYLGLGVVSVAADDSPALTPLKSLYLGAELELARSSSLAVTFVARRVSRLPEPYTVGSPFVGATVPTVDSFQPGVALVLNVSPELFRVSANPFSVLGSL